MSDFTLQYPYTEDWDKGYIVTNGQNRKNVILYNSPNDRSTTSYSRYLVSVSLGRYLQESEHVDHIDEDKTNNNISNLQILNQKENNLKASKHKGRLLAEIKCPSCSSIFTRRKGRTQAVDSLKGKITCCTKECSYDILSKSLTVQQREVISKNSLLRIFRVH